jgi:cell shape-determining protein MreC
MSYLLDQQKKRKKYIKIFTIFILLVLLIIFQRPVFSVLGRVANFVASPFYLLNKNAKEKISDTGYVFSSKKTLHNENIKLKNEIFVNSLKLLDYNTLLKENEDLKNILNRKKEDKNLLLAYVLSKPNKNIYDSLTLDVGTKDGVLVGDLVFALGDVPLGRVAEVFDNSSRIVLFSSSKEVNNFLLMPNNINVDLVGRGGGSFEIVLPRDLVVDNNALIYLPGENNIIAKFEKVISSERDAFQKVLFTSPVNMHELRFVQVAL